MMNEDPVIAYIESLEGKLYVAEFVHKQSINPFKLSQKELDGILLETQEKIKAEHHGLSVAEYRKINSPSLLDKAKALIGRKLKK
jgi:hypothetical protein